MTRGTVITDASFWQGVRRKRPARAAGWAAWVRVDGLQHPVRGYGSLKHELATTSTLAEMYAVLNGLWLAHRHGASNLIVRTDCEAVIQVMSGSENKLRPHWVAAIEEAGLTHLSLEGRHVKGHGVINTRATWVNDWCDRHAYEGMTQQRGGKKCLKIC